MRAAASRLFSLVGGTFLLGATCPWAGATLRSPPLVFGGEGVQNDKHIVTVLKKIDLYAEDFQ